MRNIISPIHYGFSVSLIASSFCPTATPTAGQSGFNGTLGDEVLKREIFYTLEEARFIIEQWRREYNQIRPHSSLGYRSPAPETVATWMVPVGGTDPSGLTYEVVQ